MLFESSLILVESEGEWTSFSVDGPLYLAQEMDCLRVITESRHLLLRLVSESMVSVLSEESDHPGRDLYLARQAYDGQDATADMMLRNIKEELPEAIHTCIHLASEASYVRHVFFCLSRNAGDLMDVPQQRDALKAAIYGFAFCTGFPNLKIYETCQKLRILKSIREPEVGIVMTMKQFREQTIGTLISRSTPLSGRSHLILASADWSMHTTISWRPRYAKVWDLTKTKSCVIGRVHASLLTVVRRMMKSSSPSSSTSFMGAKASSTPPLPNTLRCVSPSNFHSPFLWTDRNKGE